MLISLEFVAIFLKKVNNNTQVHIVDVLAKDLSFCRGVLGGVAIQQIIKHTRLKQILATHKRARRERETERETQKPDKSGDTWVCRYFKKKYIYIYIYTSGIL